MGMLQLDYDDVRRLMRPGDVIAFGGKARVSRWIKLFTRSPVSHVGIILQSQLLIDGQGQPGLFNNVIEATQLDGFSGVSINRLSSRLDADQVWWLPLHDDIRAKMDAVKFFDWLLHQEGKLYDAKQALGSALDLIPDNDEDFGKLFCSELVAGALEASGAIGRINASEVVPGQLCRWKIFAPGYYQIVGDYLEIAGYNTQEVKS